MTNFISPSREYEYTDMKRVGTRQDKSTCHPYEYQLCTCKRSLSQTFTRFSKTEVVLAIHKFGEYCENITIDVKSDVQSDAGFEGKP
jgi:hypothetical protein